MNAQFWLYFATALLLLAFVWGVVDVLGTGLLRAYRRYQVRKECLRQTQELIKLAPKAPWFVDGDGYRADDYQVRKEFK
jgi:hypothetical protein